MNGLTHLLLSSLTAMCWWTASTAVSAASWSAARQAWETLCRKEAAMGNTNGIISAPINLRSDAYKALGASAKGGWYDTGDACTSFRINEFSLKKPVRHTSRGELTEAQWKDVNYGYHIPDGVGLVTLMGYYVQETLPSVWIPPRPTDKYLAQGWWYEPPVADQDWFRMTDFEGYNRNAVGPLFRMTLNTTELTNQSEVFSALLTFPLGVGLADFGGMNGSHIGIFAVLEGNTSGRYTSVPDGRFVDPTIYLDAAGIKKFFPLNGTYKVYAFATTASYQNYDSDRTDYMANPNAVLAYPLPIPAMEVTMATATGVRYLSFDISLLSVVKSGSVYQLKLIITAKNEDSQSRTFVGTSMRLRVRYYNEYVDTTGADAAITTTSVNIAAGATATVYDGTYSTDIHHYTIAPFYVEATVLYPDSLGNYYPMAFKSIYYDGGPSIDV